VGHDTDGRADRGHLEFRLQLRAKQRLRPESGLVLQVVGCGLEIAHKFGLLGRIEACSGHSAAHVSEPGVPGGRIDGKAGMTHPQTRMAPLLAVGGRATPVLGKEHRQTSTGTVEFLGRVHRQQQGVTGDAFVETIHERLEERKPPHPLEQWRRWGLAGGNRHPGGFRHRLGFRGVSHASTLPAATEGHDGAMAESEHHDRTSPLRVANCSGFFGDRLSAAREMVDGGPIDVLTGDWLAELTMLILARQKAKDPAAGYARTFVTQMADVLGDCVARGIKVVSNAGGQNPAGCAAALERLCAEQGIDARIAWVAGDDLLGQFGELTASDSLVNADTGESLAQLGVVPVTANAYLGAWGIVEALAAGADVVVTGRVTDAAVVVAPAAWHFGWSRTDWDQLAGAVVAGHIIECGTQCTGGNYAFFDEVAGLRRPGFPIAEIHADGSSVITKHPGTGGAVTVGTVTAQLLYEIQGPVYLNPDASVRLDSIRLTADGPDRVRVHPVAGLPGPDRVKVAVNSDGGWRNAMTFVLTGLDIEAKATLVTDTLWSLLPGGREAFGHAEVELLRADRPDPATNAESVALLRVAVADPDRARVGRSFSDTVTSMLLASYPGMFTTTPPGDATPFGVYWPVLLSWDAASCHVGIDGTTLEVGPPPDTVDAGALLNADPALPPAISHDWSAEPTTAVPLGRVVGARSGDKGGNANVGFWVTSDEAYEWLCWFLDADRLRELVGPEADGLEVSVVPLPNLRAINGIVRGLLGRGVAATLRLDAQAKGLGEYLRAKVVDVPTRFLG
jgi:hypothetical protein